MSFRLKYVLAIGVFFLLGGCGPTASRNPLHPGQFERHVVELVAVQIDNRDFGTSLFGNDLSIEIKILQNGKALRSSSHYNMISGRRGERRFKNPIRWVIDFDPKSTYQVVLKEVTFLMVPTRFVVPKTPKAGFWPIGIESISIGKNSFLEFSDRVVN